MELLRITLRSIPDPALVPPEPNRAESVGNRLVAAWQAGGDREEIFQRIFNAYYRPVHSFFVKRGFPADQCQDLAQETILKVYRGLPAFRREARFETWLFQIAANIYRNTLRSQSTLKREAQEVPLGHGDMGRPRRRGGSSPAVRSRRARLPVRPGTAAPERQWPADR